LGFAEESEACFILRGHIGKIDSADRYAFSCSVAYANIDLRFGAGAIC
jgi:hypothetical protein